MPRSARGWWVGDGEDCASRGAQTSAGCGGRRHARPSLRTRAVHALAPAGTGSDLPLRFPTVSLTRRWNMAADRIAEATWEGNLAQGQGRIGRGSSGLATGVPVTWASRTEEPGGKTSPEELLAAAHASCFAMAMSHQLAGAGHTPERLHVRATATFDKVGDG